ncbi:MAG TPA: hypothetical protein VGH80_09565 [Xanthomonadaceae bacterium]
MGRDAVITLVALPNMVSVEGWLSSVVVPARVDVLGGVVTSWRTFGRMLATYPKGKPVEFELCGAQLRIDRLWLPVRQHGPPDATGKAGS